MRIAEINMIPYGSTGKIMFQIARAAREKGHTVKTYSTVPYDKREKTVTADDPNHFLFGSKKENKTHYILGSLLGRNGCFSRKGTKALIHDLKAFSPDIVHLHNLHKFCIHFPMLFRYLKKSGAKVVWTLHDCWAFTGKCPHFVTAKCEKWKTGCHHCPQLSSYPKSRMDNTRSMYKKKKVWFCGVPDMTLVTPSQWLCDLVGQSYLKEYPAKVIHNGIDLNVFHPIESDFKVKYHCESKKLLLGVSMGWSDKKGLDVFLELAKRLDWEKYQLVLVGTNETIDALLPENIISVHRTQNQTELAEIYTAADLFINPTREDTYPTVNMEALACGTPVLTFRTGGSPEMVDERCGSVIECDDISAVLREVERICTTAPYSRKACLEKAKMFDMYACFGEYVHLYEEVFQR